VANDLQITISAIDNASAVIKNVQGSVDNASTSLKGVQGSVDSTSTTLKGLATQLIGVGSGIAIAVKAFDFMKETFNKSIAAAAEEQSGLASLNATVQSMGLTSEISADKIRKMAEYMQAANEIFSHDDLEKAAQSFLKIEGFDPSNLQKTLSVVEDFAAGTGKTAADAGNEIARALETGQVRSLGFSAALRTQVQDMIKAGDQAGALALIMDTLNSKYGGQAIAQLNTYDGGVKAVKNSWGELYAAIGERYLPTATEFNSNLAKTVQTQTAGIDAGNEYNKTFDKAIQLWKDMGGEAQGLNFEIDKYINLVRLSTESGKEQDYIITKLTNDTQAFVDVERSLSESNFEQSFSATEDAGKRLSLQFELLKNGLTDLGAKGLDVWNGFLQTSGMIDKPAISAFIRIQQAIAKVKGLLAAGASFQIIVSYLQSTVGPNSDTEPSQQRYSGGGGGGTGWVRAGPGMEKHLDADGTWSFRSAPNQEAGGGSFSGWAMVGDSPGGGVTPYTEFVYAPHGATVYNQAQMSGQSAPPMAAGGMIGGGIFSDSDKRWLANTFRDAVLKSK
jgi:hypothetical protein